MVTPRKRARAKPEALAARKLADGTQPGAERHHGADLARAMKLDGPFEFPPHREDPMEAFGSGGPHAVDERRAELRSARLDRALDLLDKVERLVARAGGFMSAEDQATMREVRAELAAAGRRTDE